MPITATVKPARSISCRTPDEGNRSSATSSSPGMRSQTEPVESRSELVGTLRLPTRAELPVEPGRKKTNTGRCECRRLPPDKCQHASCPNPSSSLDHVEAIDAVPDELDRYAQSGEPRADDGDVDMVRQTQTLHR